MPRREFLKNRGGAFFAQWASSGGGQVGGQVDACMGGVIGTYEPLNLDENRSKFTHEKNHLHSLWGHLNGGVQVLKRH